MNHVMGLSVDYFDQMIDIDGVTPENHVAPSGQSLFSLAGGAAVIASNAFKGANDAELRLGVAVNSKCRRFEWRMSNAAGAAGFGTTTTFFPFSNVLAGEEVPANEISIVLSGGLSDSINIQKSDGSGFTTTIAGAPVATNLIGHDPKTTDTTVILEVHNDKSILKAYVAEAPDNYYLLDMNDVTDTLDLTGNTMGVGSLKASTLKEFSLLGMAAYK